MSDWHCCVRFAEALDRQDRCGMPVVPRRSLSFGDFFFLRSRAVNTTDEASLDVITEVPVVRATEQAIAFCPWCGARLADKYKASFEGLPFELDDQQAISELPRRSCSDG